ncbi:hypothetical protein [Haloplanus sp.]|uniref:hypothetical protein n=1 Tax=Haloplanus sp. TaxID=1961696 RepID=UPI002617839F|nr:hypothetical protein [Haloplanus sp.]
MDRRKFLVGLGSLAAGGAAASGTGAFTAATMSRSANVAVVNDSNALVAMEPGGARGLGDRVSLDGNGELAIDIVGSGSGAGVNDQSKYQLGAMNDDAQGDAVAFESIFDSDTNPAAAGSGEPFVVTGSGGVDQSAFVISNNSGQTIDLEVGLELNRNTEPGTASVFLQGKATAISADRGTTGTNDPSQLDGATDTTQLTLSDNPSAQQALSFNNGNDPDEAIPAGEQVYVSFQVDATEADTSGEAPLPGSLVVNANEAADPGTE